KARRNGVRGTANVIGCHSTHVKLFFVNSKSVTASKMLIFLSRFWTIGLLICGLAMPVWAQGNEMSLDDAIAGYEAAAHQTFQGVPDDWSTHHVVFSRPEPGSETEYQVQQDPRYWLQQIKEKMPAADAATFGFGSGFDRSSWGYSNKSKKSKLKKDWSEDMGSGAKVGAGQYPA